MKLRVCSRHLACVAGLLGFATFIPGHAFGQINSASASVTLNAILAESLTFSTPSKIIFTLSNNQFVCGNSPVNLTTKRTLAPTRTSVVLYGFFGQHPLLRCLRSGGSRLLSPYLYPFTQTAPGLGAAGRA
jgi:hypothetical protein